ncbi:tandem-95 repeat protein, partial [Rubellimicrobium roseum]
DGTIQYTPKANYFGDDSFTYTLNGGATATVNVTVTPVNDAPVAVNGTKTGDEDTTISGSVSATDVENTSLTYSLVNNVDPAKGIVKLNSDGSYSFTPVKDFFGEVSFTYKANDGIADSNVATMTLTVNPVNDAPVAVNDSSAVDEDQTVILDVLSNDSDVDGDALTIVDAKATSGTVVVAPVEGKMYLSYTASSDAYDKLATGASLQDTITYKVSDGKGGFSTATATVKVTGVNDGVAIVGTNQADTINGLLTSTGKDRDETIEGLNANDALSGKGGADRLIGGNGDDKLFGDTGWDELYGDNGNDFLDGGLGLDFLDGGLGDDRLTGGADADTFHFTKANGNDTITDFQVGLDKLQFATGVSIKGRSLVDTDGNGSMDATRLLLSTGTVTLNGVMEAEWGLLA